jgi:hypothetical protein
VNIKSVGIDAVKGLRERTVGASDVATLVRQDVTM